MVFRILLPPPRIELMPPAVEALRTNNWATREVSQKPIFMCLSPLDAERFKDRTAFIIRAAIH